MNAATLRVQRYSELDRIPDRGFTSAQLLGLLEEVRAFEKEMTAEMRGFFDPVKCAVVDWTDGRVLMVQQFVERERSTREAYKAWKAARQLSVEWRFRTCDGATAWTTWATAEKVVITSGAVEIDGARYATSHYEVQVRTGPRILEFCSLCDGTGTPGPYRDVAVCPRCDGLGLV